MKWKSHKHDMACTGNRCFVTTVYGYTSVGMKGGDV